MRSSRADSRISFTGRLAVACAAVLVSGPAWAYLDPGTGSLIIQGIIGGIAAAGVVIKVYWYRVKSLFSGSRDAGNGGESEGADSQDPR